MLVKEKKIKKATEEMDWRAAGPNKATAKGGVMRYWANDDALDVWM